VTRNASQAEVEAVAAKWLRFAKDREGGRLGRMRLIYPNGEAQQPQLLQPNPASYSNLPRSAPVQQIAALPQLGDADAMQ